MFESLMNSIKQSTKSFFSATLMNWLGTDLSKRDMPWKKTNDPYHIWISEIILQQTQVKQGLDYYLKFVKLFPDVSSLANAQEEEVLSCWKGLGYYSRARNLHATAKYIVDDLNGVFPSTYQELLKLKGVGPYSAAAISSFAFDEAKAVVDGNVYRLLGRFFAIEEDIQSSRGKKIYQDLADQLIDTSRPGKYNQAIMDFGALICKPALPLCDQCPLNKKCSSLKTNTVLNYPIKTKKIKRKKRFFHFIAINKNDQWVMKCRQDKDIWRGLYQFPAFETQQSKQASQDQLLDKLSEVLSDVSERNLTIYLNSKNKQLLTHQEINAHFYVLELDADSKLNPDYQWIEKNELNKIAIPKIIDDYIKAIILQS